MVKSYFKYEFTQSFGTVASTTSNLVWTPTGLSTTTTSAGRAIVAANEEVLTWDIKKGELLGRWRDDRCSAQVTAISQSKIDKDMFAVGYDDGSIRLWDSTIATPIVSFNGHRSAITVLAFDRSGVRLASGSKDTDVIVWDIVAEVGQFKLRGHEKPISGLRFIEPEPEVEEGEDGEQAMGLESSSSAEGWLVTTGVDSLIKLWDLSTRYCFETQVAQTNKEECWALGVSPDCKTCITGGRGGELRAWKLNTAALLETRQKVEDSPSTKYLELQGTFIRQHTSRAIEIIFHPKREYFAVHGPQKSVEVWRKRSEAEIKKSLARKRRRRREKAKESGDVEMEDADDPDDISKADVTDLYQSYALVRTAGKVRSVDWAADHAHKDMQLLVGTFDNQLELYSVTLKKEGKAKDEAPDYTRSSLVEIPGHRSEIRSIALSSDDKMLASASNGSLKVWNVKSQSCIRTFDECGEALCCAFLPGDKIIVVGTKSGELQLFDVASAALLDSIKAHEMAIWGMQVHPNGKSLASGSEDKTAKFWDFKIVQEQVPGTLRTTPRLRLALRRTVVKVSDGILALRFSPDAKYLAVGLRDNTVKVFFTDSLKLYLNLYGHSEPVISMDISYDSKLIVTGSGDRTIKIWGLDFGDVHRTLRHHLTKPIMAVAFVPHNSDGTGHHFFSTSRDNMIRYWDADKFQHIQRLAGHHSDVMAMSIAHSGRFIVSASYDMSIRVWDETDEQLFLEEERERELEEAYESTLTKSLERDDEYEYGDAGDEEGKPSEVVAASKQTMETLTAGERIQESLELGMGDLNVMREWEDQRKINASMAPPQRHIIFMAQGNISAEAYVLRVLEKIKSAALMDALRILRFSELPALFTFLEIFARRGMNVALTCKILFFMLKTHHKQIVGAQTMRASLDGIREGLRTQLASKRDMIGFNVAALGTIGKRLEEKGVRGFVDEEWEAEEAKRKALSVKKRGFVQIS
ncbi:hypothetical protein MKZ38_002313 [Zalerion maritima]|uniref:Small-subunit processome Utp12 domain-containing protein n=1 Tax=Zalerion maritima TaxID=339359 RepID=A0AAD5RVT9_9PEZI|nr:hypothetical protein MKZ38_002313 [Zalerion maritima]